MSSRSLRSRLHLREKRLSLTDPFTDPLAGALQAFKAGFPHGGPRVENRGDRFGGDTASA
jgi:hypothetical protein